MKLRKRLALLVALVLVLSTTMALTVSAAKPTRNLCGILGITTSGSDLQRCMAVCIAEEDGNYVYCGNRPVQEQVGIFMTVTNSMVGNNTYNIDEDISYDEIKGVYRFALKDKVGTGFTADVFPKMAEVSRKDTVYFVSLSLDDGDYIMEKTKVSSIRDGVITTADGLEEDSSNGEFSVIFNDEGNVVGFCKSGVATALMSSHTLDPILLVGIVVAAAVVVIVVVLVLIKKKKKTPAPVPMDNFNNWDTERTSLSPDTVLNDFNAAPRNPLVLKCHGGYQNGRIYPIPAEGITIGREPSNSIRYPAQTPGISRQHVKLYWQNGQLMLVDMGSSNGTYLNRTGRIAHAQPVPLNPGDVFYLGEKLNAFEVTYP